MGKKSYQSQASSSSYMFNSDVRMLECWCGRICAVRKANTLKNPERMMLKIVNFVWVDEAEELGYFQNNRIGAAHGRKTRVMEKVQSMLKAKESGNDEVWRATLMDKVDCI
uniref:Uncharacterized protein n=1 Tax=Medicago truncatula TaxID=3880 RepID=A2Q6H1_MEDTR|nr:hypothetical protein MtrDRAFT_AC183371g9v1 [Medicago truncatula]